MTYGRYLKEHPVWLAVFGCLMLSVEVFLLTFAGSGWLMIYVAVAFLVAMLVGTYWDYKKWKRYFEKAEGLLEELSPKYLLCELLEEGITQEERKLKEILYQMEVSMNERVSKYRRNSKEYKEFVETWVHEIKIPIATAKMILANHKDVDFGLLEEVERMEGYVEQALFYARSNDVEKDYLINRVSLQQVIQNVILKRRKVLRGKNTKIQTQGVELDVFSDSKWLEFIVGQVVDNSIKYSPKEAPTLEFVGEKQQHTIFLHIKDNGAGIKATELEQVFEKGFTGTNGRIFQKSTGIGLYLCRKLCDRLEHKITISSIEGEGTTVTLVFPLSDMISVAVDTNK